jgi:hypothetical protein
LQIKRDEPRRFRQFTFGSEGKKAIDDLHQIKARGLKAFRDTAMREFQPMIEKIEILASAVGKIRLHHHEATAPAKHAMDLGKAVQHILPRREMFIDVTRKYRVERRIGERTQVASGIRNGVDVCGRILLEALFIHIQGVFRRGMHVINEVAVSCSEIQDCSSAREIRLQITADGDPICALLLEFVVCEAIAIDLFFHWTKWQV